MLPRMSAPTSAAWQMGDRLAGGQLAEVLLDMRASGQSWPDIARNLHTSFGVVAHVSTLADWHRQLTDSSGDGADPQVTPSTPAGTSPDDPRHEVAR